MREIDGIMAGKVYLDIAEDPNQRSWLYTYTQDGTYKDFGEKGYLTHKDTGEVNFLKGGRQ